METSLIINSIGTATPNVSKLLADAFKMPQDFILKMLYNAPSVLFSKVEKPLAEKAATMLTNLGLEVEVTEKKPNITVNTEKVDISIHLNDVSKLPVVTDQLSQFLGCSKAETLNTLLTSEGIILGGVSTATALALQDRIDAKVCFTNPKNDLYTLRFETEFPENTLKSIISKIKEPLVQTTSQSTLIKNLTYEQSNAIWRSHQSTKKIRVVNQNHQQSHLELNGFNLENSTHTSFLVSEIKMPENILAKISNHLPIRLCEHISAKEATKLQQKAAAVGIDTSIITEAQTTKKIRIENIEDTQNVKEIISQFMTADNINKATTWESEESYPLLIARYVVDQLEQINCNPSML